MTCFHICQNEAHAELVARSAGLLLCFALVLAYPSAAHASLPSPGGGGGGGSGDPLTATLCFIVGWFTGVMGQSIATLGIIVLGIGAMMGKVSWGLAMITTAGIAIMFSGAKVAEMLVGSSTFVDPCGSTGSTSAPMIQDALCAVAQMANNATGKAIATIAIFTVGVSALMGKISAPLTILVVTGIGVIFGADKIGEEVFNAGGGTGWMGCTP